MEATDALTGLMQTIDDHRWGDMAQYLHPSFRCHLVHTGEAFGREEWITFNASYPGFDRLQVEEMVGDSEAAACRSSVTSQDEAGTRRFACASFAEMRDGLIVTLTEVWADVDQRPPERNAPGSAPEGLRVTTGH